MTAINYNCSPDYFLGALATDGAPPRLAVKIAQGYAAALEDLDPGGLHEWTQATAKTCLSRGWQESALSMLCSESEHRREFYLAKAEEASPAIKQKEA